MAVELIFNEISCSGAIGTQFNARAWMTDFLKTIKAAIEVGCNRTIRVSDILYHFNLTPEYTISQWKNDPTVPREEKQYLTSIQTKIPVVIEIPDPIAESCQVVDVTLSGFNPTDSAKIAYLMEGLLISLKTNVNWDTHLLNVVVQSLSEVDGIIETEESVRNASHKGHIETHRNWIESRRLLDVTIPSDLWQNKETLFPTFTFNIVTRGQILRLDQRRLKAVKKTLDIMSANLRHPGLNIHKYNEITGANGEEVFEAYAENRTPGAYRILFHYNNTGYLTIVGIIPHPEY